MPTVEGAHPRELVVLNNPNGKLPKEYIHSAIAFSLRAEFLNMWIRPKPPSKKSKRNTYAQEAANAEYLRMQ